ncbi:MAG: glycosyltransferase [Spongiibacteraceae bacterium]
MSITVRHVDLGAPEAAVECEGLVYTVFWWGELPLGARLAHSRELPFGPGQCRAIAIELLTEQLKAREPALGAPLSATHEGSPRYVLTLDSALTVDDLLQKIELMAQPSSASAADISLVICTRDRIAGLTSCLQSIEQLRVQPGEVIVVDNSDTGSARSVCEQFATVIYVHESRPGLSIARNTGIRTATKNIIAFTDDDVEVHPGWLAEIARAFAATDADAATGLVLPACLDTPAQCSFQFDFGGFGSQYLPLLFGSTFFNETRPFGVQVWRIGAGANMAFRRTAFERAGLFDERLGAGASGCSEDSEFWYRLLAHGGTCIYEPRAVVFHKHRREWSELKKQLRTYMRGHVSALVAQADEFGDAGNWRRMVWQLPKYFAHTLLQGLRQWRPDRLALLVDEVVGWFCGLRYAISPKWRAAGIKSRDQ